MILVLVSSLFISSRAHVGAEDEDVASSVLTTDSTAVLCRTYSGNGGSCCSQESRQPLFGSHLCPASKSVQLKSARPLQFRNKTIPLLANCVFPCRVADPHYESILASVSQESCNINLRLGSWVLLIESYFRPSEQLKWVVRTWKFVVTTSLSC